ncbi:MAG: hypothetical protein EOP48_19175 [Sphingobacteriales bacterium]|nr:MAG: hypothetical protein EOP48_19175 [Sphingobacteriales bacterium]
MNIELTSLASSICAFPLNQWAEKMSDEKKAIQALKEAQQEDYLKEISATSSIAQRNEIAQRNSGFALFVRKNKHRIKITFSG